MLSKEVLARPKALTISRNFATDPHSNCRFTMRSRDLRFRRSTAKKNEWFRLWFCDEKLLINYWQWEWERETDQGRSQFFFPGDSIRFGSALVTALYVSSSFSARFSSQLLRVSLSQGFIEVIIRQSFNRKCFRVLQFHQFSKRQFLHDYLLTLIQGTRVVIWFRTMSNHFS